MKIRHLHLENIKCFENINISFVDKNTDKPLNVIVLVGENGAGKTTVLKSITSCFTINNGVFGGEILSEDNIRKGYDYGHISIDSAYSNDEETFLFEKKKPSDTVLHQWIVKTNMEIDGRKVSKGNGGFLITYANGSRVGENAFVKAFSSTDYSGSLIFFFDVFRVLPRQKIIGPNSQKLPSSAKIRALSSSVNSNASFDDRFKFVKQWIINVDYKEAKLFKDIGKESGLLDKIKEVLNEMFNPYMFSRVTDKGSILFKTHHGEIDIDELSDGIKSVFVIIGELLFRLGMITYDDEKIDTIKMLNTEAIVLVDEIDCHLHPKWQLHIIPSLRKFFPNVQFIFTTHSPLIVQSVRPEEVFKLGGDN